MFKYPDTEMIPVFVQSWLQRGGQLLFRWWMSAAGGLAASRGPQSIWWITSSESPATPVYMKLKPLALLLRISNLQHSSWNRGSLHFSAFILQLLVSSWSLDFWGFNKSFLKPVGGRRVISSLLHLLPDPQNPFISSSLRAHEASLGWGQPVEKTNRCRCRCMFLEMAVQSVIEDQVKPKRQQWFTDCRLATLADFNDF